MSEKDIEAALSQSGLKAKRFSDVPTETASRYQFMLYPAENKIVEDCRVLVSPSASRSDVVRAALCMIQDFDKQQMTLFIDRLNKQRE